MQIPAHRLASIGAFAGMTIAAAAFRPLQAGPLVAFGIGGAAAGFALSFLIRLARIGDKALKRLEKRLDDDRKD